MTVATLTTPTVFHPQVIPPHPAPDVFPGVLNVPPLPSPAILILIGGLPLPLRERAGVRGAPARLDDCPALFIPVAPAAAPLAVLVLLAKPPAPARVYQGAHLPDDTTAILHPGPPPLAVTLMQLLARPPAPPPWQSGRRILELPFPPAPPPPPPAPPIAALVPPPVLPLPLRERAGVRGVARLPDDPWILAAATQPWIPPPLLQAQIAPTGSPVITAVLRAKRGLAARLDPTTLYSDSLTEVPAAVAAPANGNIVRARLSGGNVQAQSLAAGSGSAWTTWTTLAAAAAPSGGFGVALAALGDTVAIAYVKTAATTTVQVQRSTNDGTSWGSAVSVANTGVVTDVALAYAPNGDLVLVTGDSGGTIRAFRSNGGGSWGAAVTLVPPAAAAINSIALTYAGDWLALVGWADGNQNYVASALFGNGSQQTANSWSSVVDVLGIAPGNAPVPQVSGFAWGADGGHAILVEQWAVSGAYSGNPTFAMECNSPAEFASGYWTEPAPFLYSGFDGADVAASQVANSTGYATAGENLVATLAPPADVDISNRVLSFVFHSTNHGGTLTLALDNSDQLLSGLAQTRNTLGLRLDLALGYTTPDGVFTLPQAQRWIVKAEASWVAGRYVVTLTAHDGWQLLHQLQSRRQMHFGDSLGLPARTVDQIIHWLCARAGIAYTAPATLSTLRGRTPNWSLMPEHSLGTSMVDLLDSIEGWLLMTEVGATVIPFAASDPITYDYGGPGDHPVLQVFHEQELQPANIVSVFAGSTPGVRPMLIGAIVTDAGDGHLLGMTAHEHSDLQLEQSNAALVASSLLRKAQLSVPLHGLTHLPQVGQRLGDVVTLTDPLSAQFFTGRVQAHTLTFNRDTSVWLEQTTLSAV